MDAAGHLYGTTSAGGAQPNGRGTVFELTPNAAKTKWTETVLYSFCSITDCADGANPLAGVVIDASGHLYGTTLEGANGGNGAVFELTPNAAKTKWTETVLYSFCAQSRCTDGEGLYAGLTIDAAGSLYGTTHMGGAHNPPSGGGTVLAVTPNAAKTKWTGKVLYSFCALPDCADGSVPFAGLTIDAGNLYGTTSAGGPHGGGTVFELTPNAAKTTWTETVLYSFCAQSESPHPCTDGAGSEAGLIMDAAGQLYGTTTAGGAHGYGTVFELP